MLPEEKQEDRITERRKKIRSSMTLKTGGEEEKQSLRPTRKKNCEGKNRGRSYRQRGEKHAPGVLGVVKKENALA